jgi:hypothetical protein
VVDKLRRYRPGLDDDHTHVGLELLARRLRPAVQAHLVGRTLKGRRDDVVLATKVSVPMDDDPNHRGNSRWLLERGEAFGGDVGGRTRRYRSPAVVVDDLDVVAVGV